MLNGTPLISEFMASNGITLLDEDGDSSDWLEIYNPTAAATDLDGWYLTDDPNSLTKWQFPEVTLGAGEYLVVFASDKDRSVAGGELHTNFKLGADGDYLALVQNDGNTVAHAYAPAFPEQYRDFSYGLGMVGDSEVLVQEGDGVFVHVPSDGHLGQSWTTLDFDDSRWQHGPSGVGYENDLPGYSSLLGITVPSGTTGVYIRIPFVVTDAAAVSALTLRMKYDDGFAVYLNGVLLDTANANAPEFLAWDSTATADHHDSDAIDFEDFDISTYRHLLMDGANILAIHGLNTMDSPDMLIAPELVAESSVLIEPLAAGYLSEPTPGHFNTAAFVDFVADTSFSVDHGFYETPFSLEMNTTTPGASLVYTLDGTEPTLTHGRLVPAPDPATPPRATLLVDGRGDGVVTVRVAAFKEGFIPTQIDTATYIFLDAVITNQTESAGTPAGFPVSGTVHGQVMDYGFAADIVHHPLWGPELKSSLEALPTLSMVTDPDNLFDASSGIYVNPSQTGKAWERPASLELIYPDGTEGFQVETGIRIRGNFSLSPSNPKRPFRLFFRDEYGDAKLNYPLFGDEGIREFDKIDLRTFQNDSWAWQGSDELTMIHDVFSRDTQRDMGQAYTRSRYYHLYINGQYWGIYQTQERSEAAYGAAYFGGERDDYDTIKAAGGSQGYVTEATDGDMNGAWRELWNLANEIEAETDPVANYALYMQAQGLNPDGTRNLAYPVLLDVDNLIDYMSVIFYTNDEDAPLSRPLGNNRSNNWFAIRDRNGEEGFRFFTHDAEQTMISKHNVDGIWGDRTGPFNNSNKDNFTYSNPQWIHEDLMEGSAEYRMRFADRTELHYCNGGALTVDAVTARFNARAAELDAAVVAHSARWGNGAGQNPSFDKNTWLTAVDGILSDYFNASPKNRGQIVLDQLRQDGLYPMVAAPVLNRHGGLVEAGFQVTMNAPPTGTVSSGDFDGDLDTDMDDFAILTDPANWLHAVQSGTRGDMNDDGFVDLVDFRLFKESLQDAMPTIYYTLDGETDPRAVGGAVNHDAAVMKYQGIPITVLDTTTIRARSWDGSAWSALTEATFTVQVGIPAASSYPSPAALAKFPLVPTGRGSQYPIQGEHSWFRDHGTSLLSAGAKSGNRHEAQNFDVRQPGRQIPPNAELSDLVTAFGGARDILISGLTLYTDSPIVFPTRQSHNQKGFKDLKGHMENIE
ncbi:MAG: CotH kinase family protein [Pirellulales bacterium]|nr:CotH kinase family protein [Pirellulales bacterium]